MCYIDDSIDRYSNLALKGTPLARRPGKTMTQKLTHPNMLYFRRGSKCLSSFQDVFDVVRNYAYFDLMWYIFSLVPHLGAVFGLEFMCRHLIFYLGDAKRQ